MLGLARSARMLCLMAIVVPCFPSLVGCGGAAETDPTAEEGELRSKSARIETFVGNDAQFYFYLMAGNGEKVLRSEGYARTDGLKNGIDSVRANGVDTGSYEILPAKNGEYYFNLKAKNGQIIATSETYVSKSNAERAVATTVRLLKIVNATAAAAARAGFETFRGEDGQYYFRLRAGNGEIVLQSEGYKAKQSALDGIASVRDNGKTSAQYKLDEAADGLYYWHLSAKNGEIIGRSETYATKSNATRGVSDIVSLLQSEPKLLAQ